MLQGVLIWSFLIVNETVGDNWEYICVEMMFLDIPHNLVLYTVIYTVIPDVVIYTVIQRMIFKFKFIYIVLQ